MPTKYLSQHPRGINFKKHVLLLTAIIFIPQSSAVMVWGSMTSDFRNPLLFFKIFN